MTTKILHVTPHLGGGVGDVIFDWMDAVRKDREYSHKVACLDYANEKGRGRLGKLLVVDKGNENPSLLMQEMTKADVILVHYWDHPLLNNLCIPLQSKVVAWCHKNYPIKEREVLGVNLFVLTSPIQRRNIKPAMDESFTPVIMSTVNMYRFLNIEFRGKYDKFIVGYLGTVGWKKIHREFIDMCREIPGNDVEFWVGGKDIDGMGELSNDSRIRFLGHVDDVVSFMAGIDVFGYPLRKDHYGTCEQVIGQAMAAGVPVVCMNNPAERTIVKDGVCGYLARDRRDYVGKVIKLKEDVNVRNWMGRMAREGARQLYDIGEMVREWNRVFDQLGGVK